MARPFKDGIDYFPMEVTFFEDRKIKLIKAEFGARGIMVVLAAFCLIYSNNGYYADFDDEDEFLLADEIGCNCSKQFVHEVVQGCIRRSIFDGVVLNAFGVLTSRGIQRRYLRAAAKRDRISIIREYWLLDERNKDDVPSGTLNKIVFQSAGGGNNPLTSVENTVDSANNSQRRVEESIGEYSRVREGKKAAKPPARTHFEPPSIAEVEAYCKQRHNGIDARRFVDYYTANGWRVGKGKMRDWRASVRSWEHNGVNDNSQPASSGLRPAAATGYSENIYAPGELDAVYTDIMLEGDK